MRGYIFPCYGVIERCQFLLHPRHRTNFWSNAVGEEGLLMVTVCFGQFSLKYKQDWTKLLGHVNSGSARARIGRSFRAASCR